MTLNLDPDFNPYPQKVKLPFEAFTFSGGEPHIRLSDTIPQDQTITITHRIRSFNQLGQLLVAVDALRRSGVKKIAAFIPYFPGARQDRLMTPGEPLTVKVYTDIINHLALEHLYILDPHSDVTPALLNNCISINNHRFIQQIIAQLPQDVVLIAPDSGATKKVYQLAAFLGKKDVITCEKKRDIKTGKLSGFSVHTDDLGGKPCLIVDDICDGGGTFLGLAETLKKHNCGQLFLAVTHGIFSKGSSALNQVFTKIFTTDSFPQSDPSVTCIPLSELSVVFH